MARVPTLMEFEHASFQHRSYPLEAQCNLAA
jgi:hypothetical protein